MAGDERNDEYLIEFTEQELEEHNKQIMANAIDEFAHTLKETLNNEFPSNYHCTQPYFTLENARLLVDMVAEQLKANNKIE